MRRREQSPGPTQFLWAPLSRHQQQGKERLREHRGRTIKVRRRRYLFAPSVLDFSRSKNSGRRVRDVATSDRRRRIGIDLAGDARRDMVLAIGVATIATASKLRV